MGFKYVDAGDLFENMIKASALIPRDSKAFIKLNAGAREKIALLAGAGLLKPRADGFYHIEDIIAADKELEKLLGDEPTIT